MRGLLAIAAGLLLWEGAVRLTGLPPYLLPGPARVEALPSAAWPPPAEP